MVEKKGLLHVYTGNGRGKTTSAIGLAVRALGRNWKVYLIQFMKGYYNYGELQTLSKFENLKIIQFGTPEFVSKKHPKKEDIEHAVEGLNFAKELIMRGEYDMVILDEINVAVDFGLLDKNEIIELIKNRPSHVELILTGRNAPSEFIELADYVTEMKEIKHPFMKGLLAREGIEY